MLIELLSKIQNKDIYLYPYSPLTIKLYEKIKNNINFCGFIDKNRYSQENIYKLDQIKDYDYILVYSPNHLSSILNDLKEYANIIPIFFFNNKYYLNKIPHKVLFRQYILNKQYKLKSFKNKHIDKRAFIIANGPSLSIADLDKLQNEITFAANKIWLAFEQTLWKPTYYTVTDKLVMAQNLINIKKIKCKAKLFPNDMLEVTKERLEDSIYFNKNTDDNFNLNFGINTGPTVVYTMISFAIYMGIKELYIIGLDHNFSVPDKYKEFKQGDDNVIISEGEVNHFHKDYRKKGEKWAQPELDVLEDSFIKINKLAQKYNVKIYNASRKTALNVFEKIDFDLIKGI